MTRPRRGEIWQADLDPVLGHEQGGERPVLVVSQDAHNAGPAGLVTVIPITSQCKYRVATHVEVEPTDESGLRARSHILCDGVRSISVLRLIRLRGRVAPSVIGDVERVLRALLWL